MAGHKYKPLMIVPEDGLRVKIKKLADAEHRKMGPMALEIIRRFFAGQVFADAGKRE